MEANKSLELARKAYPNDENLRVAYLLGLQKGAENLEEAVNDAKDLDIEKTLNGFQNFYAHENSGEFPSAIEIERHFYKLGLEAQKGE